MQCLAKTDAIDTVLKNPLIICKEIMLYIFKRSVSCVYDYILQIHFETLNVSSTSGWNCFAIKLSSGISRYGHVGKYIQHTSWKPNAASHSAALTMVTHVSKEPQSQVWENNLSFFWSLSVHFLQINHLIICWKYWICAGKLLYRFFKSSFFVLPLYQKIFHCAQTVRGYICVLVNSKQSKWSLIKMVLTH